MKRSFGISLLLLSSGIVLGGGGMYLVHISTSANNPMKGTQVNVETTTSGSSLGGDSQLNRESGRRVPSNNRSIASLEEPNLHTNSFQRRLAIYTYVAGLSVQELTNELQGTSVASKKFSQRVQDELQTVLVERQAIVNPEAAVKFAVAQKEPEYNWSEPWYAWQDSSTGTETTFMPVVQSVFSDWALSDLRSAISKAKSLGTDAKSNALTGILATQAGQSLATHRRIAKELGDEERGLDSYLMSFTTERVDDPKAAWAEVVTLVKPNNSNHSRALGYIARQWYEQDGFSVLDEISASSVDKEFKSGTIRQLLWQAAQDNPEQAFQYALTMPSEGLFFSPTLNSVVYTWSASDPQSAYQAVSKIEKSGQRENLQRSVVSTWASNEPRYVLDRLDSFSPNIRDNARSVAIVAIARTSPKEAAEIALEHSGETLSNYHISQILHEWIDQDVEAAVNWVFNGPVSEEKRHHWVSALAGSLVESDPRRAFDLASQQKVPEDSGFRGMYQTGLEADIIRQITYQNLELAVELLPRVREGPTRTSAFTYVGNRYIDEGHSAKALNLGLKLPTEEQASYFQSISFSWARIDPDGFVESIENIPTPELRSTLARSFMTRWASENFTDAQLAILKQHLTDSDRQAVDNQ